MKIVITGSLGHISKPLAQELLQQKHIVTVISSNIKRQKDIEALGAKAAIGSLEDPAFLATTFTGADAVYCMEPPANFQTGDLEFWIRIGKAYAQSIRQSAVKRVVHLSSIGAHTNKGVGLLRFHYEVENILQGLPADVAISFLRPVGFYYNLFAFIPTIRSQDIIATNHHLEYKEPWVSPRDIAAVAAEEITLDFSGRRIRYIASDELTSDETAGILGTAIGYPGLKWVAVADDQLLNGMIAAGINPKAAQGLTEMNAGRRDGALYEDYFRNKPILGKVKLKDFAKEFAEVYNKQ
jgi:uncharacterized protein YbjT (DUF2867 family)